MTTFWVLSVSKSRRVSNERFMVPVVKVFLPSEDAWRVVEVEWLLLNVTFLSPVVSSLSSSLGLWSFRFVKRLILSVSDWTVGSFELIIFERSANMSSAGRRKTLIGLIKNIKMIFTSRKRVKKTQSIKYFVTGKPAKKFYKTGKSNRKKLQKDVNDDAAKHHIQNTLKRSPKKCSRSFAIARLVCILSCSRCAFTHFSPWPCHTSMLIPRSNSNMPSLYSLMAVSFCSKRRHS